MPFFELTLEWTPEQEQAVTESDHEALHFFCMMAIVMSGVGQKPLTQAFSAEDLLPYRLVFFS